MRLQSARPCLDNCCVFNSHLVVVLLKIIWLMLVRCSGVQSFQSAPCLHSQIWLLQLVVKNQTYCFNRYVICSESTAVQSNLVRFVPNYLFNSTGTVCFLIDWPDRKPASSHFLCYYLNEHLLAEINYCQYANLKNYYFKYCLSDIQKQ
jgi:hypothetical protein